MKLIDILLRDLSKHGGWPHGVDNITQYSTGELCFNSISGGCIESCTYIFLDPHEDGGPDWAFGTKVTREQYEAALAASKTEWGGEGLPPVGCVCEVKVCDGYEQCEIVFSHPESGVAYIYLDENEHGGKRPVDCISPIPAPSYFRPIRSEADKKRDEIIEALKDGLGHAHGLYDLMQIYHLLNNGKIPHIRID